MGRTPNDTPKKKMGRPPKSPESRQTIKLQFVADSALAERITRVVNERFKGNFSEFARDACQASVSFHETDIEAAAIEEAQTLWLDEASKAAGFANRRDWLEHLASEAGKKLVKTELPHLRERKPT